MGMLFLCSSLMQAGDVPIHASSVSSSSLSGSSDSGASLRDQRLSTVYQTGEYDRNKVVAQYIGNLYRIRAKTLLNRAAIHATLCSVPCNSEDGEPMFKASVALDSYLEGVFYGFKTTDYVSGMLSLIAGNKISIQDVAERNGYIQHVMKSYPNEVKAFNQQCTEEYNFAMGKLTLGNKSAMKALETRKRKRDN